MKNASVTIDNELLEKYDFEGMLVYGKNHNLGMLVLSSKDDSFTLHIYKLRFNKEQKYEVEKELVEKSFSTLVSMQYFLKTFSTFTADEFIHFIQKYEE